MKSTSKPIWQDIPENLITPYLPESLQDLLRLIPLQAVLGIVFSYGGIQLYIPINPKQGDSLVKLIGMELVQVLANYAGGTSLDIPVCRKLKTQIKNSAVLASLARGASQSEAARAFDMTERNLRRIKKTQQLTKGVN